MRKLFSQSSISQQATKITSQPAKAFIALFTNIAIILLLLVSCDGTLEIGIQKPLYLKASDNVTNRIEISWQKVNAAESYLVYRSKDQEGNYSKIGETTSTFFTDENILIEHTYYYKAKATRLNAISEFSDADEGSLAIDSSSYAMAGWWGKDNAGGTGWHSAGSGKTGVQGSGNFEFWSPRGIAVVRSGSSDFLYVADTANKRLQKFRSDGTMLSILALKIGGVAVEEMIGIAIGKNATIFVTDWDGGAIGKYDNLGVVSAGWVSPAAGGANGQLDGPWQLATDDSHIYVANEAGNRIGKFTQSTGSFNTGWGSSGTANGQFMSPTGIATDSEGFIYVADNRNHRIQKFTSGGQFVTKWGKNGGDGSLGTGDGEFNRAGQVAIDKYGYVYVTDWVNHRVQKFTPSGIFVTKWGSSGSNDGQFSTPDGIAVGKSGYVYVTDFGNHRIQKYGKM